MTLQLSLSVSSHFLRFAMSGYPALEDEYFGVTREESFDSANSAQVNQRLAESYEPPSEPENSDQNLRALVPDSSPQSVERDVASPSIEIEVIHDPNIPVRSSAMQPVVPMRGVDQSGPYRLIQGLRLFSCLHVNALIGSIVVEPT